MPATWNDPPHRWTSYHHDTASNGTCGSLATSGRPVARLVDDGVDAVGERGHQPPGLVGQRRPFVLGDAAQADGAGEQVQLQDAREADGAGENVEVGAAGAEDLGQPAGPAAAQV